MPQKKVSNLRINADHQIDEDAIKRVKSSSGSSRLTRRRTFQLDEPSISAAKSIERAASSFFAMGGVSRSTSIESQPRQQLAISDLPGLSKQVTVGRNSRFYNLTKEDRERLGGIEYRSLKLLLKIVLGTLKKKKKMPGEG